MILFLGGWVGIPNKHRPREIPTIDLQAGTLIVAVILGAIVIFITAMYER